MMLWKWIFILLTILFLVSVASATGLAEIANYTNGAIYDVIENQGHLIVGQGQELRIYEVYQPDISNITGLNYTSYKYRLFNGHGQIRALKQINNETLFVASENGLAIWNITNLATTIPLRISDWINTGGIIRDVEYSGGYIYLPIYGSGIQVIDVSASLSYPLTGDLIPLTTGANKPWRLVTDDTYLYIAQEGAISPYGELTILHLSPKSHPTFVSNFTPSDHKDVSSVAIDGDYAHLVLYYYGFVTVKMNVDRTTITEENKTLPASFNAADIKIANGTLYVSTRYEGFRIYSMSTTVPTNSSLLSTTAGAHGYTEGIYPTINRTYLSLESEGALIFDSFNINSPAQTSIIENVGGSDAIEGTTDGKFFFIGSHNYYVWSVNSSNLSDILEVNHTVFSTNGRYRSLILRGNYLYSTSASDGRDVTDVTDPMNPTMLGTNYTGTPEGWNCLDSTGNWFYDSEGITDFTDKTDPILVYNGGSPTFYGSSCAMVNDSYMYLGNLSGLSLMNVTIKTAPTIDASYKPFFWFSAMAIDTARNLLYAVRGGSENSTSPNTIVAIDISDAKNPVELSSISYPGTYTPYHLYYDSAHQLLYSAGSGGQVKSYNVMNPSSISLLDAQATESTDIHYWISGIVDRIYTGGKTGVHLYTSSTSPGAGELNASFAVNATSGTVPRAIQFNDTSTGYPTNWELSFGDDTWYNATTIFESQSHVYSTMGNYSTYMNVSNATHYDISPITWINLTAIGGQLVVETLGGTTDGWAYNENGGSEDIFLTQRNYPTSYVSTTGNLMYSSITAGTTETPPKFLHDEVIFLGFNSSDLPDDCTITDATVEVWSYSKTGTLGTAAWGLWGYAPATNGTFVAGDYDSRLGTPRYSDNDIPYADIATGDNINHWHLNVAGINNISKTGYTNIMLSEASDIDGAFGGTWASGGISSVAFVSSRYPSEAPALIINYTIPATTPVPNASFTTNNTGGKAPVTTLFNDTSDTAPTTWNLSYDDGQWYNVTTLFVNQSHTYTQFGNYSTYMIANNTGGSNTSIIHHINVTEKMVANFSSDVTTGTAPLSVQFYDNSTNATSWSWTFGDGNTSTNQNPTNTYFAVGSYPVSLTAYSDSDFNITTKSNYITVTSPGYPDATFQADIVEGHAPLLVAFTSNEKLVTSRAWNLTTGGTVVDNTTRNASYTYSVPGLYSVNFTVSNLSGTNSSVKTNYINVTSPPAGAFDKYTVAVLHMNATNGSTSFVDSTGLRSWSTTAPAQILTTNYKYGYASGYFGAGGNVTTPNAGDPNFIQLQPNRSYTADFWFLTTTNSSEQTLIGTRNTSYIGAGNGWRVYIDGSIHTLYFEATNYIFAPAYLNGVTAIQPNVWHHVALTQNASNYLKLYLDGKYEGGKQGLLTAGGVSQPINLQISGNGTDASGGERKLRGYIDEIRISNTTRWIVNFTPFSLEYGLGAPSLTANFTATPLTGNPPLTAGFTDYSIGEIKAWNWSFGDSTATSTSQNPSHTYTSSGLYSVNLTITDATDNNATLVRTDYINVTGNAANFSAVPLSGMNPLTVAFTDLSVGCVTNWNWSFGDGNVSTTRNPTFKYNITGTYSVNLTVTGGNTSTSMVKTDYITVASPEAILNSTISLIPKPKELAGIGNIRNVTLAIQNTTQINNIFANITFNKTSVNVSNVYLNTSQLTGLTLVSIYNNNLGWVSVNVSGTNITSVDQTSIADIAFQLIDPSNTTVPLNYVDTRFSSYTNVYNFNINNTGIINVSHPTYLIQFITVDSGGNPILAQGTIGYIGAASGQVLTVNGTANITSPYGWLYVNTTVQGYYGYQSSYLIDGDAVYTIAPTAYYSTSTTNWYSPHPVRINVVNEYGVSMPGVTINASVIESTIPAGTEWLKTMYGLNPEAANEVANHTLFMYGTTMSDGSATFTMLASMGYSITVSGGGLPSPQTSTVYPLENDYTIWTITQTAINNTYVALANTTLTFYEPNASFGTMGLDYYDPTGLTQEIQFYVIFANNDTTVFSQNFTNVGFQHILVNYTAPNQRGQGYRWKYDAARNRI